MADDPRPDPSTRQPPTRQRDPDAEEMQKVANPVTIAGFVIAGIIVVLVVILSARWLL